MKTCDLSTGIGQLTHAFSNLKDRWTETKTHWSDDASRQFEETHLQPIPAKLQLALAAIQRLAEVIAAAEQELDDRPEETL